MKKLLVFAIMLLPMIVSAQTRGLINRIDREEGTVIKHEIRIQRGFWDDKPLLNEVIQGQGKSFNIVMSDTVVNFDPGALATMNGSITNLTTSPVKIVFNRTHLRIPADWTSSVCFGLNCFSSTTDSIPPSSAFNLDPGITGAFILNIYDLDPYTGKDSIIDYIRFTSISGDPGDTLSLLLKGVLNEQAGVQDNKPKSFSSNAKITAIYPSPLVQGNSIKVKVSSPRESNLSYRIYDGLGRVVALGVTRQHIGLGDNTIGIGSLDELGNGSYMLKFSFGDGTSDTHFFQVMR